MEEEPVPFTWLLELLYQTGHHPNINKTRLKKIQKRVEAK
jgi:hypothetical protein